MKDILILELAQAKTQQIATLLANQTVSKIMTLLEKGTLSKTEMAKQLQIPLNTIHYNIEQLVKAGIVKATTYSYSVKGKEINHYELVSKYIVITSKQEKPLTVQNALAPLFVVIAGMIIFWPDTMEQSSFIMDTVVTEATPASAKALAVEAMPIATDVAQNSFAFSMPDIAWFALYSLIIVILVYALPQLYSFVKKKIAHK